MFEVAFIEGVSQCVKAGALKSGEHGAVLLKVGVHSVLEGLKEVSVVGAGGRGVVRGGGKDSSWKSRSD